MKTKSYVSQSLVALLVACAVSAVAAPVGTAFTYQGRLNVSGVAANGGFDLTFRLFNDPAAGSQVGSTLTNLNVAVSNGLFTTTVDFGTGIFDGTAYWLAIGVRSNGAAVAFTTLPARQPVTPSPYAVYASAAPLPDGSVTSAKILDSTVGNADLAANAVTSAKIADGTIVGADLTNNTVGSDQLADSIDLGRSNVVGQLDVFYANTALNQPAISLVGSSSRISTYGSDGQEQIRLYGPTWGELWLFDSTANNNVAVTLSANSAAGGFLELNRGATNREGLQLNGGTTLGGEAKLFTAGNQLAMDLRAQFSSGSPGAWIGLYHTNQERITFAAQNGDSGRGGLIDIKNNSSLNTIRLIGDSGFNDSKFEMYAGGTNKSFEIFADDSSAGSAMYLYDGAGSQRVEIDSDDGDDGAIIRLKNSAGSTTITLDADLSGDGRITTQELQITGGSDLSEQFDITSLAGPPEPGMVVCIDPKKPGQLIASSRVYDRTVAGVISGAGGVKPGMLMGQKGTAADGQHPVALSGRVYALADTCNGPIEPGDLITTSDTPGHAMKATDAARAHGAILGKAMTGLTEGKGLVLVLVSLQ